MLTAGIPIFVFMLCIAGGVWFKVRKRKFMITDMASKVLVLRYFVFDSEHCPLRQPVSPARSQSVICSFDAL